MAATISEDKNKRQFDLVSILTYFYFPQLNDKVHFGIPKNLDNLEKLAPIVNWLLPSAHYSFNNYDSLITRCGTWLKDELPWLKNLPATISTKADADKVFAEVKNHLGDKHWIGQMQTEFREFLTPGEAAEVFPKGFPEETEPKFLADLRTRIAGSEGKPFALTMDSIPKGEIEWMKKALRDADWVLTEEDAAPLGKHFLVSPLKA